MAHDPKQSLVGSDDDAFLAQVFADARSDAPLPSADLLARIEADAARLQPLAQPVRARAEPGLGEKLGRWVGRLALPSGLVAAGLTGVWIGLSFGGLGGVTAYSLYDSDLGMQIIYEFPALAGILPEG